MSDETAFLRAIAESPEDDAPRLVFADWLDDQGDHARAEFIRTQCEIATLPASPRRDWLADRAGELLDANRGTWEAGLPHAEYEYQRGFLNAVSVQDAAWAEHLPTLATIVPPILFRVRVDPSARVAGVADMPALSGVRRLCLESTSPLWSDAMIAILRSPHLDRLTELDLSSIYHLGTLCPLLAAWPSLIHLRRFGWRVFGSPDDLRAVLASPHLTKLRSLTITEIPPSTSGVILALLAWPGLADLEELHLREPTDESLLALARCGSVGRLRQLSVHGSHSTSAGFLTMLASPGLPALRDVWCHRWASTPPETFPDPPPVSHTETRPLRSLSMVRLGLGNAGVGWLVRLPRLNGIHALRLKDCRITSAGAKTLADSPSLSELQTLFLTGNRIGSAGVEALARSPNLGRLESLCLSRSSPGIRGIQALSRSMWTRSLIVLGLSNNTLTRDMTRALARTPFESLRVLDLQDVELPWSALAGADWLAGLEKLWLLGFVSDADASQLARSLGPSLRLLQLRHCEFGVVGLRALLARDWPNLRTLDLSGTRIGTPGVRALAGWAGLARLTGVRLGECGIGTVGLSELAASPYLHRACTLTVSESGIKPRALDALRERVSGLVVE